MNVLIPTVLHTEVLKYARPMKDAGERIGAALEAYRISGLPWWKRLWGYKYSERESQMDQGWRSYEDSLDLLQVYIEHKVREAYEQGRKNGG